MTETENLVVVFEEKGNVRVEAREKWVCLWELLGRGLICLSEVAGGDVAVKEVDEVVDADVSAEEVNGA
ncbi:hypothetical protein L484_022300 [Morus notabilis]|uniref:Uncharacterized protein n=1 Tax=Morus notabilis TaxID=981085 RepID=W9SGV2_9ROSA|nr:hypothetical protein L484_022300 [Morus notabilis]